MRILVTWRRGAAFLALLLLAGCGASLARGIDEFGSLPLAFEPNRGQTDANVAFLARGAGYQLFVTPTQAVYKLQGDGKASVVRMELVGARGGANARGVDRLPGESHYLMGAGRDRWITHVPQYGRIELSQVYRGIDLAYYGNASRLEYDFTVSPGADPRAIAIEVHGTRGIEVDGDGRLVMRTPTSVLAWKKPVAYQEFAGVKRAVPAAYVQRGKNRFGFRVGRYDRRKPLVIDPILSYSTLLGGTGHDHAYAIAVDGSGGAVITGETASNDFPATAGAYSTAGGGVFVARLNATGTALDYSTFLGAGRGTGIALQGGNAYVTGVAPASFPVTAGAYNDAQPGDNVFVAKLAPDGSALVHSALFGAGLSQGAAIAVDAAGNAYVTGTTASPDFPTSAGAFQPTRPTLGQPYLGDIDAFLVKMNAAGSALLYSTYLGSTENDFGEGIAIDAGGMAYVAGTTTGRSAAWNGFPAATMPFPATAAAFQSSFVGGAAAFVVKFDLAATGPASVVYSTLLGGNDGSDQGHGIAVDGSGSAYVTGSGGPGFPRTAGAYGGAAPAGGAFVAKLDAAGSVLAYSAMIPGAEGRKIALDSARNAFVAGVVRTADFATVDPLAQFAGGSLFVTKIDASGAAAAYSTYIDGHLDARLGIATDPSGAAYVAGTAFQQFFTTPGAYRGAIVGAGTDAFVSKIVTNRPPVANAGADQAVIVGTPFTLDASGSSDPDGTVLQYEWRDAADAIVGTSATVSLTRPQGVHAFTLTVSDGVNSASASVHVTVEAVLSINLFGAASGRVSSTDGRIDCTPGAGAGCSARYAGQAAVTLTAAPGAGAVFSGWRLACAGSGACTVTVADNVIVGAQFDVQGLALSVAGATHGRITSPSGIDCGSVCSAQLPYGTQVVLTAIADPGYLFDGWSGDCSGTATTCSLTLDANRSAVASFRQITAEALSVAAPASTPIAVGGQRRYAATATFSDGSARSVSAEHSVEGSDGDVCAINRDGTVKCWGARYPVPVTVPAFENAISLSAGTSALCALFQDGTVNCEGSLMPVAGAVAIAAQSQVNCALLSGGGVRCWEGTSPSAAVASVSGISGAVAIGAEGGAQACAVLADGSVSCWFGLGDGTTPSVAANVVPRKVVGVVNATSVAFGVGHGCALISDGTVTCWGDNAYGQLGNGVICDPGNPNPPAACPPPVSEGSFTVVEPDPASPAANRPLADVVSIVAGDYHACALASNGAVKCWGRAWSGGRTVNSAVATTVPSLAAVAVAAGAFTTCATLASGTLSCWGDRASGGPPLLQPTLIPQPVAGMDNILALSWASADPSVARMTSSGTATGAGAGATTITAASPGATSANAGLTVAPGGNVTARALAVDAAAPVVTVSFASLALSGTTTVAVTDPCPSPPPAGFQLGTPGACLDLSSTAVFSPPATVCIAYGTITFAGTPQLFHFEGGAWTDVTTSVDPVNQIACGAVTSFSPFALMERADRKLVADAGPDRDTECTAPDGTPVTLDGSRSSRGPGITYEWKGKFGRAQGMVATVKLPLGTNEVKLEVSRGHAKAQDELKIRVKDTRPPVITAATAEPSILGPPDGRKVPVAISVSVKDLCDAEVRCRIDRVTSDEVARDGERDRDSSRDWETTGALTLRLRADRSGRSRGRTYSIEVVCTDDAGNRARRAVLVAVPAQR